MGGQGMNERALNLLSMCMQAKEKGHDVFFCYSPHVDKGEIDISVYKNGWKEDIDPDKRFMVTISGKVGYMESSFAEVEAYLKELLA
jgi:hypothetical protein